MPDPGPGRQEMPPPSPPQMPQTSGHPARPRDKSDAFYGFLQGHGETPDWNEQALQLIRRDLMTHFLLVWHRPGDPPPPYLMAQPPRSCPHWGRGLLAGQGGDCHSPPVHGWRAECRALPPVGEQKKQDQHREGSPPQPLSRHPPCSPHTLTPLPPAGMRRNNMERCLANNAKAGESP